jgi:hypothetical protein
MLMITASIDIQIIYLYLSQLVLQLSTNTSKESKKKIKTIRKIIKSYNGVDNLLKSINFFTATDFIPITRLYK